MLKHNGYRYKDKDAERLGLTKARTAADVLNKAARPDVQTAEESTGDDGPAAEAGDGATDAQATAETAEDTDAKPTDDEPKKSTRNRRAKTK